MFVQADRAALGMWTGATRIRGGAAPPASSGWSPGSPAPWDAVVVTTPAPPL